MDLLNKLLLMKELKFSEGRITLLKHRSFMATIYLLDAISMFLDENPEITPKLYRTIRDRVKNKWGDTLVAYYGLSSKDHLQKMFELSSPLGWGKSELIKYDEVNGEGIFRTFDAPVGVSLKGNLKFFAEHLWRGITAGTASTILKREIDVIETKCIAQGADYCEFIFMPSEKAELVKEKFPFQV
ncbi:MAG TPA: 4-vinyl reductase [Candidatus Nanoarchaeia archaeon]|nr:4-vinyl reductase [Candidatus Nanoarchaeia archaeon]